MKKFIIISSIIFGIAVLTMVILYFFGMIEYASWKKGFKIIENNSANVKNQIKEPNGIMMVVNDFYKSRFGEFLSISESLGMKFPLEKDLNIDEIYEFSFVSDSIESNSFNPYLVVVKYKYLAQTNANASIEVVVNDSEPKQVILDNFVYYDFNKKIYDRYGNEIVPEQVALNNTLYSFFKDGRRISNEPVAFELNKGSNVIKIKNLRKSIRIEEIAFVPAKALENLPDYETFKKQMEVKNGKNEYNPKSSKNSIIFFEAEQIFGKNDFLAGISNLQIAQVTPYEILKKKVNVVEENMFKTSGQELFWMIYVETSGFYKLGFRYRQSLKPGVPVFRNLYIDGKIQFSECKDLPFEFTSYSWKDKVLPYEVYLDKGYHIISLEVSSGIYADTIAKLQDMVKIIQKIGLDIRKLVGNNLDPNRTWNIEKYMPGVIADLNNISKELRIAYGTLIKKFGDESRSTLADLVVAADLIDKILKKPEKLPFFLDELSEGSSSVVQRLSELSLKLRDQSLGLDKVYVFQGDLSEYVRSAKTWLISAYEEIAKFGLSLLNKNQSYSVYENTDVRVLRVWINRSVQYVETLQYLIDTDFTKKTGIPVVLSLMPNEQKLILAASSGNTPDVAMSISSWIPFELAIRKALYPLSNFSDFFETISKDYNVETLLPMVIDDKVYGAVETQNFYVLFYRKDILSNLNVPIPDTWDDVKKILPELQRRGMNFFIPMCEQATKYFNTTAPFFFQNDAKLYTKNGLRSALSDENSVKAFELMTELFSIYGMPEQVASFYNSFRYGKIPIGVGDFGLYVVLSNAADELYGAWDIAPSPGVPGDNGKINRYQVSGDRAAVIFESSDKKEKAWIFLKWWLSKETQLKFAQMLINRYGPTYFWNTANINAFNELDFIDERHKRVILKQWQWIREVQRHPGGYMTEREVSNIWNKVVVEGYSLRNSIDRSVISVNRELERKLTEFGYIKEGKPVKPYKMYDSMREFIIENLGERAQIILDNQKLLWGENYGD